MTSPAAAPGELELVRRFVNTWDEEDAREALATPVDLRAWLEEAAFLAPATQVGAADLRKAVALREALREAMVANHGGDFVPPAAVGTINAAAGRAGLSLVLGADAVWTPHVRAGGVDGALGALLVLVAQAAAQDQWRRLKVCINDTCRWAFYDHSRARTGKWCSMQVCGNRAKQNAWRARHAGETAPT